MSSDFSETIGAIFFSILILSLLVDIVLSGTWNRMYFTSGIPIFIMRIPVSSRHINIPLSSRFEKQFNSKWTSALVFREIDLNTYGFREKFFDFRFIFHYSAVMHGMLFFDSTNNQVVVKGFANWFELCFAFVWIGSIGMNSVINFPEFTLIALAFIIIFFLGFGLLYSIQHHRFSNVAKFAAEEWTRRYVTNVGGA